MDGKFWKISFSSPARPNQKFEERNYWTKKSPQELTKIPDLQKGKNIKICYWDDIQSLSYSSSGRTYPKG